jgi:hypothetical protein
VTVSDDTTVGEVVDTRDLGAFIPSVLDDYPLDPYEFRVYARVVRRASGKRNQRGHDEGAAAMGQALGCSERQVRYALRVLERARLIVRTVRPGTTDRFDLTSSSEWVAPGELAEIRKAVKARKPTPAHGAALHVVQPGTSCSPAHDAGQPCTTCNPPRHPVQDTPAPGADEGSPQGSPGRASQEGPDPLPPAGGDHLLELDTGVVVDLADDEASFGAWWLLYPRQHGTGRPGGGGSRSKSLKRWSRMSVDERRAAFVALPNYRLDLAINGHDVAHTTTWLNEERWEIYAEPPDTTLDDVAAALVSASGGDPDRVADGARAELSRAAHQLPDGTTAEDVAAVARAWRKEWPDADPSPLALVRHWHRFAARATGRTSGSLCGACGQPQQGHDAEVCAMLRRAG